MSVGNVGQRRWGVRPHPIHGGTRMHDGVDIPAAMGSPVVSFMPGTVVRAENAGGYGNLVVVDHGNGVSTYYAHLSRITVRPGMRVGAGVRIGSVGSTGQSTGPHLHFEVRNGGRSVDPMPYLEGRR